MRRFLGVRMFDGREYLLSDRIDGWTPEEAKAKALAEAERLRKKGKLVRLVKVCSIDYKIYVHG